MNIEQANAIPLSTLLEKLDVHPAKQKNHQAWYLSPLRSEKTASFKIDTRKNVWYDFGAGEGGDTVSFICRYLRSINEANTVADALRWINNMSGYTPSIKFITPTITLQDDKTLSIKSIQKIEHRLLKNYLANRGIELHLADKLLKQVRVYNSQTKKSFFALGFCNEEKGFELRNPYFKGCIGAKDISFVRGQQARSSGIHLFEGFMDFLSVLSHNKVSRLNHDTIVLNSLSCLAKATPYIKNYGYKIAYSWMDNDDAGVKAEKALNEFFKTEQNLTHIRMNKMYAPHKDVNAWHMHHLGLGV